MGKWVAPLSHFYDRVTGTPPEASPVGDDDPKTGPVGDLKAGLVGDLRKVQKE
jgi:hypothetical protein